MSICHGGSNSNQEYVLDQGLFKIEHTANFFNLKKLKNQIAPNQEGDLKNEHLDEISKGLNVDSHEVVNMNRE